MSDRSTDRLVHALVEAGAPTTLLTAAREGRFHDFNTSSATPIADLVRSCEQYGLTEVARQARNGAFDATPDECDQWRNSPEGRRLLEDLVRQGEGEYPH